MNALRVRLAPLALPGLKFKGFKNQCIVLLSGFYLVKIPHFTYESSHASGLETMTMLGRPEPNVAADFKGIIGRLWFYTVRCDNKAQGLYVGICDAEVGL